MSSASSPPTVHIKEPQPSGPRTPAEGAPLERVVSTRDLLGNARRVWIDHCSERYLLQVTRAGKLILTK